MRSIRFSDERVNFRYTGILKFEILVKKESGKNTKELLEKSLKHILEFTQKHAGDGKSNFSVLPKDVNDNVTPQISSYKNFPEHQITYLNKYFVMTNAWSFADLGKFVFQKMLRGSMRVGSNVDIKRVLDEVGVHLGTDIRANLVWKGVQKMETSTEHILLGLHDAMQHSEVERVATKIIEMVDRRLGQGRTRESLLWSLEPGRPEGMPFRMLKEGERWEDNGRRGFVFTVPWHQTGRFDNVMEHAKSEREWAKVWGDRVFTIKMVPAYSKDENPSHTQRRAGYQDILSA